MDLIASGAAPSGVGAVPSLALGWTPPHDKSADTTASAFKAMAASKKRRAGTSGEHSSPERGDTESSSVKSEEHNAPVKPRRKRKHRKSTHTIRKEEKELLLKEMEELNAKVADLKQRAMSAGVIVDEDQAAQKAADNVAMRRGLQKFQFSFSEVLSAMSEYAVCNIQAGSPLHDSIFLSNDQESRRQTLCTLRAEKLRRAKCFMQLRRPDVDPSNLMVETRRYEAPNGDFWSTNFTVMQFRGARSVKQVFDQLLFYFCNIEISVSEKIGHITIREDDDCGRQGTRQNRLVSVTNKGVKMESNTVIFSEYTEHGDVKSDKKEFLAGGIGGGDSGYGFIVADFVEGDERHPYQSGQRVRKDINAVLEIRACPQASEATAAAGGTTVVLTKWMLNRLHHPNFPMQHEDWVDLRDTMDLWGQLMQRSISEGLQT